MKISLLALSAVMASKNNNRAGYTKLGIFMFRCNHVTFTIFRSLPKKCKSFSLV